MSKPKTFTRLLKNLSADIVDKLGEKVVGIIVFGSTVENRVDVESDIDIVVVYNNIIPGYEENVIDGREVEILFYPISRLKRVFSKSIRNRDDTWYRTCFWLNVLRNGRILYDTGGILGEYRLKALKWKWTKKELKHVYNRILENLEIAKENASLSIFNAVLSVRDATNLLVVYNMLKKNQVPSYRPKEIYSQLEIVGNGFREIFEKVMGLNNLNVERLTEVLQLVERIYLKQRHWSHKVERAFKEVFKSLNRGNNKLAVLSARHFALLAVNEYIERVVESVKIQYFYSKSHLRALKILQNIDKQLFQTYKRIHFYILDSNLENYIKNIYKTIMST